MIEFRNSVTFMTRTVNLLLHLWFHNTTTVRLYFIRGNHNRNIYTHRTVGNNDIRVAVFVTGLWNTNQPSICSDHSSFHDKNCTDHLSFLLKLTNGCSYKYDIDVCNLYLGISHRTVNIAALFHYYENGRWHTHYFLPK